MIESPYAKGDRDRNLRYLAWCEYHSAEILGEFPIASHGNCTAYWPEDDEHRAKGLAWRNAMRARCGATVFYVDLGMSGGMQFAKEADERTERWIIVRKLPTDLLARFEAGEYPPGSMRRIPAPA
jgi:hypothetical protein